MQLRYIQRTGLAVALVSAAMLLLQGCGEKQVASKDHGIELNSPAHRSIVSSHTMFPDSAVVVRVNSSPITMREVGFAMRRIREKKLTDEHDQDKLTETALESLIGSRLIALEAESQLGEEARALVDLQTAAYREQLLVKAYLKANAEIAPVSDGSVKNYYEEHPEEFGRVMETRFEVIETTRELETQELLNLRPLLQSVREVSGWREWLAGHRDLPLGYRQQSVNIDLLEKDLKAYLGDASPGDVNVIDNGRRLQLIRILDKRERPPKAFDEVSGEIRKKLAPIAYREKLNKHVQELRIKATIRYTDPERNE